MKDNDDGKFGIASLLTIIFITLKLLKVINWNWLWVVSPMWISAIIVMIFILICILRNRRTR